MSWIKKFFYISLLLLTLSLLFWGAYKLSFSHPTEKQGQKEKNTSSGSNSLIKDKEKLVKIDKAKIVAIVNEPVLNPVISHDGLTINYFSSQDHKFYQINFNGSGKKALFAQEFPYLTQFFWSPDKLKVILKLKNSEQPLAYLNFQLQTLVSISKNIDTLTWNSSSNKIYYKFYNPQNKKRSLNIANPDASHWNKLTSLEYEKISLAQVPKTGLVSFWNSGDAYQQTKLQTISAIGENAQLIFKNTFGTDYLWSPSGNKILLSHTDVKGGHKIRLAIMNANGGEYTNLDIPTFISKCVWSRDEQSIYYTLPGGIDDNAVLPNDYKSKKFNTGDTFWKVNLKTGEKTRLLELSDIRQKYDASQLFLNKSESLLFFVNRIDQKLYKINL